MADASDSKSDVGDYVWVQVPSLANIRVIHKSITFYFIFFFVILEEEFKILEKTPVKGFNF